MKTTKALLVGVAVAATVVTNQNVRADNLAAAAASASASVHRLVLASPHALEEFPWLLRGPAAQTDTAARQAKVLADLKKNPAFAASPRVREQFPELDRAGWASTVASSQGEVAHSRLSSEFKNRAWIASPRVKEQYPWLARGYTTAPTETPVQVAPLK